MLTKFELSDEEAQSAEKFMNDHDTCRKTYVGAIGGHFGYHFYPTSLGVAVHIQCDVCKQKKDISDYAW